MLFNTGIGDVTTGPQPYLPASDPIYAMLDANLQVDAANQAAMDYYGVGASNTLSNWFTNNGTTVGLVALGIFVLIVLLGSKR